MALQVTFDVFSGRPNPVVALDGADAAELLKRLQSSARLANAEAMPPFESALGYRGLIVEQAGASMNASLPTRFRVVDGKLFAPGVAHRIQGAAIEDFVIGASANAKNAGLTPDLAGLIRSEAAQRSSPITLGTSKQAIAGTSEACKCGPLYEPEWWNDGGQKQLHNNCYNYACNYRTDTFAQPGRAGGVRMTALSCPGVKPSALSDSLLDDLRPLGKNIQCPPEGNLVALVIWPNWDFHWYRLGRDGLWTHKPGGSPVTNLDNAGKPITDPRTADRGRYTAFCSFMIVMDGHIKIS